MELFTKEKVNKIRKVARHLRKNCADSIEDKGVSYGSGGLEGVSYGSGGLEGVSFGSKHMFIVRSRIVVCSRGKTKKQVKLKVIKPSLHLSKVIIRATNPHGYLQWHVRSTSHC